MKRTLGFVIGLAGLVTASVLGAVNCGESTIISQTVGPEGAAITITAEMDRDLAGTELVIPPGALSEPTRIWLARAADTSNEMATAVGPAVFLGPDGQTFQKPITLTLPTARPLTSADKVGTTLTETGYTLVYYNGQVVAVAKDTVYAFPDDPYNNIKVTPHFNTVSIESNHATTFQPVIVK
jgi:hypothetical protein